MTPGSPPARAARRPVPAARGSLLVPGGVAFAGMVKNADRSPYRAVSMTASPAARIGAALVPWV